MLRHLADWVKTCHCLRRSWVSQIHYNCQVTHRADTQDVRDTGLTIHIPQQSTRTPTWMRGHVCTKLPGKKDFFFFFCSRGGLRCQKCQQHWRTLFEYSYMCGDLERGCELTWHEFIITSELKRDQRAASVFVFWCRNNSSVPQQLLCELIIKKKSLEVQNM